MNTKHIATHPEGLLSLVVANDQLFTGGVDNTIRSWSKEGEAIGELVTPTEAWLDDPMSPFCLAANDKQLFVGGTSLRTTSFALDKWGEPILVSDEGITALTVQDSKVAVACGEQVTLFSITPEEATKHWETYANKWVYGFGFSPQGNEIAAWTWATHLHRFDLANGQTNDDAFGDTEHWSGGPYYSGVWFDEHRIALVGPNMDSGREGFFDVWNTSTSEMQVSLKFRSPAHVIAAQQNGLLAVGCDDGTVTLLNIGGLPEEIVDVTSIPLVDGGPNGGGYPLHIDYDEASSQHSVVGLAWWGDDLIVGLYGGQIVRLTL